MQHKSVVIDARLQTQLLVCFVLFIMWNYARQEEKNLAMEEVRWDEDIKLYHKESEKYCLSDYAKSIYSANNNCPCLPAGLRKL